MPELRPVVMRGPSVSHEQQQQQYDQQQYFDHDAMLRQSPDSQTFGSQSSEQQGRGPGHNNINNRQLGDGSLNFNNSRDPSTLDFGDNIPSTSSLSNSNQPRLRVANLPRASTSFGGFQHNFNSNPEMSPGYSPMEANSYAAPPNHLTSNHDNSFGFDNEPRVTIIRTTSTIEFTNGTPTPPNPFNGFGNADFNGGVVGPALSHSSAAMGYHQQTQQSVLMGAKNPHSEISGHGVGAMNRRAQRQSMQRATVHAAAAPVDLNAYRTVQDLVKNQESLAKENADLKRKLHLLVSTFNDEQKLHKVLRCLEEKKRRAAHSQAFPRS